MAICANPACRKTLTEYQWGEGFCSYQCMAQCSDVGEPASETLHDPTGKMVIAKNSIEVSALLESATIDKRLPTIIVMRKQKHSLQSIGNRFHISKQAVYKILKRLTPNIKRECRLR